MLRLKSLTKGSKLIFSLSYLESFTGANSNEKELIDHFVKGVYDQSMNSPIMYHLEITGNPLGEFNCLNTCYGTRIKQKRVSYLWLTL